MTDYQIHLLQACQNGLSAINRPDNERETMLWLSDQGLCELEGKTLDGVRYVLTPAGKAFLDLLEKAEREKTEAKRQHDEDIAKANENMHKQFKHDWRIAIFSFVTGTIFGAILDNLIQALFLFLGEQ